MYLISVNVRDEAVFALTDRIEEALWIKLVLVDDEMNAGVNSAIVIWLDFNPRNSW